MTVKPCSTCGGTGKVDFPTSPYGHRPLDDHDDDPPCPRCEGMPKLKCPNYITGEGHALLTCPICQQSEYYLRSWFFPDPDSVMWWCFVHGCEAQRGREYCKWEAEGWESPGACDLGWVPRPDKPLEVVE